NLGVLRSEDLRSSSRPTGALRRTRPIQICKWPPPFETSSRGRDHDRSERSRPLGAGARVPRPRFPPGENPFWAERVVEGPQAAPWTVLRHRPPTRSLATFALLRR